MWQNGSTANCENELLSPGDETANGAEYLGIRNNTGSPPNHSPPRQIIPDIVNERQIAQQGKGEVFWVLGNLPSTPEAGETSIYSVRETPGSASR